MAYEAREKLALPESNHSLSCLWLSGCLSSFSSPKTMCFLPPKPFAAYMLSILHHRPCIHAPLLLDMSPLNLNAASYRKPSLTISWASFLSLLFLTGALFSNLPEPLSVPPGNKIYSLLPRGVGTRVVFSAWNTFSHLTPPSSSSSHMSSLLGKSCLITLAESSFQHFKASCASPMGPDRTVLPTLALPLLPVFSLSRL